jgi:DNA repair protein RecO (recombination protein O)
MKQLNTIGIVLARTDYGEADRILTLITPDYGKLHLMAKGVRRIKSKMAGGIELFSVSNISFVQGRGDMGTLTSTRLAKHYGNIVKDLDRTMLTYELIKKLNKITEDQTESEYFELLKITFESLDDNTLPLSLINFWFSCQLLKLSGHTPNLLTDQTGQKLQPGEMYGFDFDAMGFASQTNGKFGQDQIKFLRLGFSSYPPKVLTQVQGNALLVDAVLPLAITMLQTNLRV